MGKYDPAEYQRNKAKYRERSLRWQKKNPEKQRAAMLRSRYSSEPTRPEPDQCECCGRWTEAALCFDHNHITGAFRGWLCSPCNRALGLFGDDIAGLEKALAYLKRAV